jgi:DNA polymerase III delta prime subunit
MREQMLWCEKYRPEKISDCVLPESIKSTFQQFANQGKIPNLLIAGSAGVGKTTIAKALCKEVGCDYIVINGSDENGIDVLRGKIKNYASSVSLSGGRKVIIIDEADYLNANSLQPALRNAIEEFSINCSFIFTCNYKNRIIEPLHSRCSVVDVKIVKEDKQKLMAQFFKRVCFILEQENIEFNKEVVAQVVAKYYPDNRRVLNELQRYSMGGVIDAGLLAQVSDVNITPLIKGLKEKSFGDVRKWVVDNLDNDSQTIYRKLYDNMYDILKSNSIPQLVLLIGKYQYQTAFVVDHEINLMAFFTECMVDLEFK